MNFPNIFWFKKSKKNPAPPKLLSSALDQRLVNKVQSKLLPSWQQLKYIGQFLTKTEKKIIKISFLVIFLTLIAWAGIILFKDNNLVPADGGDYSEALIGQPQFINPLFAASNDVDNDLSSLVYSGLFKYNDQQKLMPDLASGYKISDDEKTYDISLREDAKWSDGEKFTADDVVFTFETIQNPEINSPLISAFAGVQVEKTGDYSVRFTLKEPFAPFLSSLTVGILPQHIWSDVPALGIKLAKTNLQPVGTGPWQFDKLIKDSSGNVQNYILSRNENYYQKIPYLQTLTFKFYTDYTQAASALKSQDVMALSFVPNDLVEKIVGKNFQLHKFSLPQYTALFFNQTQDPDLKNDDLRTALAMALNKQDLINGALKGEGTIVNSPILKQTPSSSQISYPIFDPAKADALLDKQWQKIQPEEYFKLQYDATLKTRQNEIDAAVKNPSSTPEEVSSTVESIEQDITDSVRQNMNSDQSFYRRDKNNNILSLSITTSDAPEYQQVAEFVAKMWRAIGIQTDVQVVESHQISKDVLKGRNYQVLLYGEIMGADPDPYPFWHSSQIDYPGLNLALYLNRTTDKIIEDARATSDEQKRTDLYLQFQEALAKDIPAIFLYTPTYNFAVSKDIKGINLNQIISPADRYVDLSDWYIKTKRQWKI